MSRVARIDATIFTTAPLPLSAEALMFALYLLAFTPGPMEIVVLGMVVLLLFGNRLPSVMRSLGVGITEFKKGIKGEPEPNVPLEDQRRAEDRRVEPTRQAVHE